MLASHDSEMCSTEENLEQDPWEGASTQQCLGRSGIEHLSDIVYQSSVRHTQ